MVMAATERRSSVVDCAQHAPNRILVIQLSTNANEAKVVKAHAAPLELCDNLVNALKPLANQQNDGDSPIESIVTGLHEKSRKGIMDGLTGFIKVDNHSAGAVDVGGLCGGTKSIQVKKPQFSEAFKEAFIRDGADELTLRAEEVGLLRTLVDTKHVELERWGLPLVDADWHAFFQYNHFKELHEAAGTKKPGDSQEARGLRAMKAARGWDAEFYDPAYQKYIQGRTRILGIVRRTP